MSRPRTRSAARRRERNRLARHVRRMAAIAASPSPRMKARAQARETYLDRVAQIEGRETGKIARARYREEQLKARSERQDGARQDGTRQDSVRQAQPAQSTGAPARKRRKAATYRPARREAKRQAVHGPRMALALKAERMRTGETRREADRRRAVRLSIAPAAQDRRLAA